MIDPKEFLAAGQLLHGHKCPAMPQGLRAGAIAMNRLGVERAKDGQLLALVELGDNHCAHCMGDGVQMITGCTFGKANIKELGYGKFGLTLVDKATGRAIRVVPKGEMQAKTKDTPFFKNYREKGVPASEVPDEVVQPLVDQVMNAPEEALFNISEIFHYDLPHEPHPFSSFLCDECGDMVVETYGRVHGDKKVCIPCKEALVAAEG